MDNEKVILVMDEPRGPSMLIEIPVPAQAVSTVKMPVVAELLNKAEQTVIIKSIRLITPSVLPTAPTQGGANAPLTELVKISLILYSEGWQKGQLIPIMTLNDMFTEGSGEPYRNRTTRLDNWKNVDWNKSTLQYSNGTPSNGAAYTVVLEVEYIRFDKQGCEIVGGG